MKRKRSSNSSHSPTLNTILMVEKVLKSAKGPITVAELKRRLPKQVMHNTLLEIIDYLQDRDILHITTHGLVWIFEDELKMKRRNK